MNPHDIMSTMERDRAYVELFCQIYNARIVDIFPNVEHYPPRGLMYVFDDDLGGYSIEGIKNSLEDKVSEQR